MKKVAFLLVLFFYFLNLFAPCTFANMEDPFPSIEGESAIVMDVLTGRVLYEKNPHAIMEPASTTKIMTAILALEKGKLSDTVVASREPLLAEGTRIYLEEGEKLSLEQILYGMMLNSGNDAAIAVAEHISGSVPAFVEMMNKKAREIGAYNTNFVNPSGLTDEGHVTTAYDLALISRYAMTHLPEFRKIVSTKTTTIPWQGQEWDRELINLNKMLWNYDGADGIKTGYTSRSGYTIVASATRDGWQLIAVVLKSNSQAVFKDSSALLDYVFENYEKHEIVNEGVLITKESVKYGDPVELVTKEGFTAVISKGGPDISQKIVVNPDIVAPIEKGAVLGQLEFYQGKEKLGSIDLLATTDIKRKIHTKWWFWPLTISLIVYVPFRTMVGIRRYKRRKKQIRYVSYVKRYR